MKKVLYISAALSLLVAPAARAQHEGHSMPGTATGTPAQQQQPAMDPRVEGALSQVERLNRVLDAARESNDPVRLRAAMDELQKSLGAISGQLRSAAPAPASGGMSGMDHSQMNMGGSATGNSGMDHSKMPGTKGMDQSKKSGKQGMDHSKMEGMPGMNPSGTAATGSKKSMPGMAPPPKSPPPSGKTKEMDHSQMDMSGKDNSMMGMPGMNAPAKKAQPESASPAGKEISQDSPQAKTKEPICFKDVDTQGAEKATYKGKTYYFCSRADREKFLSDPAAYVNR